MQHFREQRNADSSVTFTRAQAMAPIEPGACIEASQHAGPVLPHPTAARSGAGQSLIVDDHRYAVGRELNVKFNAVSALAQSQVKGNKGILRCLTRGAAMADFERWPNERRGLPLEHTLQDRRESYHGSLPSKE